jgi:tetratricopeptide (TPR) repeat protein
MTELTIDQALQQGVEAHKAGQVQEADRLYTAILKAQPKHPDANHNMGVIAVGVGKVEKALSFFKTALEANPATAQFWLSYIDALIKLDRLVEAKAVLDQAKSKGAKGDGFDQLEQRLKEASEEPLEASKIAANAPPPQPNILDSLKVDHAIKLAKKKAKDGAPEEAKRIYQDILTKFPKNKRAIDGIKALAGRPVGKASKGQEPPQVQIQELINLYSHGLLQQALKQAETLVQQFPKSPVLFNIQGAVFKGLGHLDLSIEAYNKALAIRPDYADAYNNMGNTLKDQGKLEEAIKAYIRALAIKPDNADAYSNMGIALKEQGKLEEAMEAYNKALAIKPDYAKAYNNMGIALKEQGKLEEAIGAFNQALAIKPDNAKAYYNMGNALRDQGKLEEAIEAFEKDGSIKSQTLLLKCLYQQDKPANFYDQLDYLVGRGENNAVIGSYISRAQIKYGINRTNPFCNEPLKYTLHTNLTSHCDFEDIFVKGATDVLTKDIVQNRSQRLLTNGIQTTGNVFNQMDDFTDEIQSILRSEIENYRMCFKDSQEGLIKSWPSDYEIYGWLVSMKSGGKLAAHMHDKGWISGSVYINVPPKVNKDSGNFVVCLDSEKDSQSIDVVTGSLCLFPSSLLHYTIPFESEENRIVLAFDVIPK